MTDITPHALANLAFWARNMMNIRNRGWDWPGFSYDDAEWARFSVLAGAADKQFVLYILTNTILFLILAVAVTAAFFLPLATLLFPVPANTPAFAFVLLLAANCAILLGGGLPLTMWVAAAVAADASMKAKLSPQPGDAELAAKVRWQLLRIVLVMCGLLVPGTILFITFNIDAGPILKVLQWASIGLMVLSAAVGALRKKKS